MPPITRSRAIRERQLRDVSSRSTGGSSRVAGTTERSTSSESSAGHSNQAPSTGIDDLLDALAVFEPSSLSRSETTDPGQSSRPMPFRLREEPVNRIRSELFWRLKTVMLSLARSDPTFATDLAASISFPYRQLDDILRSVDRDFVYHWLYLQSPRSNRPDCLSVPHFLGKLRNHVERVAQIREEQGYDRICNDFALAIYLRSLERFSWLAQREVQIDAYVQPIISIIDEVVKQESTLLDLHLATRRQIFEQFEDGLSLQRCESLGLNRIYP